MPSPSLQEAYEQSVALLHKAATPDGFVASVNNITNYQRIWTRDGVITGLAALLTANDTLITTFKATLQTIFSHQHPVGFFPSNVEPHTHKASYGGNCGRVDNVSWAVIGLMQYTLATSDGSLAQTFHTNVIKAFAVMDAWEFNGKHLMYGPQSGNWADEYVQHGYILYDQLLRVWALELAGKYYQRSEWLEKAAIIRQVIGRNYWNNPNDQLSLYAPNLIHQLKEAPNQYWLMGFNPARVYNQFDLAANALALLLRIGTVNQQTSLLSFIIEYIGKQAFILPSFAPAIEHNDFLMHELADNYAYEFRNLPHEFHNGGLWPVWNGWMGAALYMYGQQEAANTLQQCMAQANYLNTTGELWGFYENFHGLSHRPIGVQYCTWSASGAIIAAAYQNGKMLAI